MKAIKHPYSIDLIGLTPKDAYILAGILAATNGHDLQSVHDELDVIFPGAYRDLGLPMIELPERLNSLKQGLIDAGFIKVAVPAAKGALPRKADGRFKSKKWVARFNYVGDKDWYSKPREVVTEYPGRGLLKPNLRGEDPAYIKGYDTERKAFRQFKVANVGGGGINWSREYID